ncbi:hypothetical protein DVA67_004155 [Solirubrobacter sp. CPCC 204708]|nr:hypothetical protein [Solirubrobacter deserti]
MAPPSAWRLQAADARPPSARNIPLLGRSPVSREGGRAAAAHHGAGLTAAHHGAGLTAAHHRAGLITAHHGAGPIRRDSNC